MSPEPINKELYEKTKEDARNKFDHYPSLYASNWISKEYVKRGGKYRGKKNNNEGQSRWFKEEWVQIIPYLKDGKKIACGSNNKEAKACRPLIKINSSTPLTMKEIVKMYGKEEVLKFARMKNKDMDGRLNWKNGTFTSS